VYNSYVAAGHFLAVRFTAETAEKKETAKKKDLTAETAENAEKKETNY
jgi:hypothetical protein